MCRCRHSFESVKLWWFKLFIIRDIDKLTECRRQKKVSWEKIFTFFYLLVSLESRRTFRRKKSFFFSTLNAEQWNRMMAKWLGSRSYCLTSFFLHQWSKLKRSTTSTTFFFLASTICSTHIKGKRRRRVGAARRREKEIKSSIWLLD